jgi:putative acetyltransferase
MIVIVRAGSESEVEAVRALWAEYWESQRLPADFQNFSAERMSLPGVYTPPGGLLLFALVDGEPAGTAAFRPLLDAQTCEAKRLFVRPRYRGMSVGRALLEKLIEEARAVGYRAMYGDTLPSMAPALRMYQEAGFAEVPPYSPDPTPGAIFLRLML